MSLPLYLPLYVNKFLETDLGKAMIEVIQGWETAIQEQDDTQIDICCGKWTIIKIALKQLYGKDFYFSRTDDYYGVTTEDEKIWLIKEYYEKEEEQNIEEKIWSAVCSGDTQFLSDNKEHWYHKFVTHSAFGKEHSLIMGALRNQQYITVFYLLANDEIVLSHERVEYEASIESYMNIK